MIFLTSACEPFSCAPASVPGKHQPEEKRQQRLDTAEFLMSAITECVNT
jgi:hypothetical protein